MIALLVFALIAAICSGSQPTVDKLEVPKYLGLWYQIYGDLASLSTITLGGLCITALYGSNEDNTISVRNFDRTGSPNGTANAISGYAYVPNAAEPGKLVLRLDGVPFDGSYWVLALGPEVNNKYQWSIVTDKTGVFLFVLARDVDAFKANYDASVKRQLNDLGYKGLTGPLPVYQGKNCKYEADIRRKQIEESFCSGCNN